MDLDQAINGNFNSPSPLQNNHDIEGIFQKGAENMGDSIGMDCTLITEFYDCTTLPNKEGKDENISIGGWPLVKARRQWTLHKKDVGKGLPREKGFITETNETINLSKRAYAQVSPLGREDDDELKKKTKITSEATYGNDTATTPDAQGRRAL